MTAWFIAEGQLHRVDDGRDTLVESAFAGDAVERSERSRRIDAWKSTAPGDDDRGRLVPRSALWGGSAAGGAPVQPRFRHVARGRDDSIYYVLTIGAGTALFRYLPAERREIRLFHGAAMQCLGIAADPEADRIVLAGGNDDGTASLQIVDGEGNRRGNLTGGDSIDASPSFSAQQPGTVLFQSCGIARHAQTGQAAAIGPATILRAELASAELATVVEGGDVDCLAPKDDRAGNLWYIRRPYERTAGEVALSAGRTRSCSRGASPRACSGSSTRSARSTAASR